MGFLALVNAYTMRITLSVAITEMVVRPHYNSSNIHAVCEAPSGEGPGSSVSTIRSSFSFNIKMLNLDLDN